MTDTQSKCDILPACIHVYMLIVCIYRDIHGTPICSTLTSLAYYESGFFGFELSVSST